MNSRVEIRSLEFRECLFGYDPARPIFRSLTYQVPMDDFIFVSGPNGSGQSTFLKLLAVLVQPQTGQYWINGRDATQMSFEEFLPYRQSIGYTFDYGGLFANRTLLDNLALPLMYHKISTEREAVRRIEAVAERFKFAGQLGQRPAAVSGGLRKLVCVLRAFLLDPQMIVMDDPFTGIGTEASNELIRVIQEARQTRGLDHLFMTSREESWAARMSCKTLWIDRENFSLRENEKVSA